MADPVGLERHVRIFVVTIDNKTDEEFYALFDYTVHHDLSDAIVEADRLKRKNGKCYAIVDADNEVLYDTSLYWATQNLPVRLDTES